MLRKIIEAAYGSSVKRRIFSAKGEDSAIILFPDGNCSLSYYGLLYADLFAKKNSRKQLVIVTNDDTVEKAAEILVRTEKMVICLSEKEMAALNRHLSLCIDLMGESVYRDLIYISEKYPHGHAFEVLRSGHFFSEKYLVWNRIYHRKSFYYAVEPEAVPTEYNGNDEKLIQFMKYGT